MKIKYKERIYKEGEAKKILEDFYEEALRASPHLRSYDLLLVKYDPEEDIAYLDTQPIVGSEEYHYTRDYDSPSIHVWGVNPLHLDPFEDLEWDEEEQCYRDSSGNKYDEEEVIEDYIDEIASADADEFLESVRAKVEEIKEYLGVSE